MLRLNKRSRVGLVVVDDDLLKGQRKDAKVLLPVTFSLRFGPQLPFCYSYISALQAWNIIYRLVGRSHVRQLSPHLNDLCLGLAGGDERHMPGVVEHRQRDSHSSRRRLR